MSILRATRTADGARVRVGALRVRTTINQQGVVSTSRSRLVVSLVYMKEAGSWKLLKEEGAVDNLAAAIMEATSEEAREQLLPREDWWTAASVEGACPRRQKLAGADIRGCGGRYNVGGNRAARRRSQVGRGGAAEPGKRFLL